MQTPEYILGDLGHKKGGEKKDWERGVVRRSAIGVGKDFVLFLCAHLLGWSLIGFSFFLKNVTY